MALGAFGLESDWLTDLDYAALTTRPERRHRVHTRILLWPPPTMARTVWRFGSNRRGLTLFAWLC
jgi:hypothetical protein